MKLSRKPRSFRFCWVLALKIGFFSLSAADAASPLPCAIRWDAWYDTNSSSAKAQNSLSDAKWLNRAPSHCTVGAEDKLACTGTQNVIDDEIRAATEIGGLDCWAFVQYEPGSTLRKAWELFQTSALRERMKWTWITTPALFHSGKERELFLQQLAQQMAQSNYLKVLSNRPLLFLMWSDQEFHDVFHNDFHELKKTLESLNNNVISLGYSRPYYVIFRGAPEKGAELVNEIGADAIGSYSVTVNSGGNHSYSSLIDQTQLFWQRMAATGVEYVPILMTGFDQRPIIERPMDNRHFDSQTPFYFAATDKELTQQLRNALRLVKESSEKIPSQVLLIYSWNEDAEGGGSLNQTLGDPTGKRLRAFRQGLQ